MITVTREDSKVRIDVHLSVDGKPWRWFFEHDTISAGWAGLLADRIEADLRQTIERIRRAEYEAGYKAGRAKKAKRTHFCNSLHEC